MKKIVHILYLVIFAVVILAGAQYLQAFGPGCAPPNCNSVSPLTVSTSTQSKTGGLSLGDSFTGNKSIWLNGFSAFGTTTPLKVSLVVQNGRVAIGTTTIADALKMVVDGSVGAQELCDTTGTQCVAMDALYESVFGDQGLTCPSTPNYTSMYPKEYDVIHYFNQPTFGESGYYGASTAKGWEKFAMPEACRSADGCVIRQKIYKRYASSDGWKCSGGCDGYYEDKLYKVKDYDYRQDNTGTAQLWSSTYSTAGTAKNGDTTSTNIVTPLYANTDHTLYLLLRDDAGSAAGAQADASPTYWVANDNTRSYGMEIYVCTP